MDRTMDDLIKSGIEQGLFPAGATEETVKQVMTNVSFKEAVENFVKAFLDRVSHLPHNLPDRMLDIIMTKHLNALVMCITAQHNNVVASLTEENEKLRLLTDQLLGKEV